ncbi:unnamed protein product [Symbiodinium sp. CCMP2592]|nr:unnamed protein product [Symbiodinium sp. CCMP2592]
MQAQMGRFPGYAGFGGGCGGYADGFGAYAGMYPQASSTWVPNFGKGKGEGRGRGKGKGKGKGYGYKGARDWDESDPRRQIELAQRRAKQRDQSAISQAQRSAQLRFEKDLLDRVQGRWIDEEDPSVTYVVEGGICAVSGGENIRTFRNRLSVYGGELCWDARRFWHNLNFSALPPPEEEVNRVEWNPAQGSPPTKQIIWVRAPDVEEAVPEGAEGDTLEAAGADGNVGEAGQGDEASEGTDRGVNQHQSHKSASQFRELPGAHHDLSLV